MKKQYKKKLKCTVCGESSKNKFSEENRSRCIQCLDDVKRSIANESKNGIPIATLERYAGVKTTFVQELREKYL